MYEHEAMNRLYSYAIYAISAFTLMLAVLFSNWLALLFSCMMVMFSVVYLHTGHAINNYLLKHSRIIEIYNGYKLGFNLTYVTKKFGRHYKGVSIAVFEPNNRVESRDGQITELLEAIKEPFEFSIALMEINKKTLVEPLETKRRMKEIALSRASDASYAKISKLKREIELMDSEIGNLAKNGKSFETEIKIRTSVVADNEMEAGKEAAENLESVASKFSVALGMNYSILKGEKLLEALEVSS